MGSRWSLAARSGALFVTYCIAGAYAATVYAMVRFRGYVKSEGTHSKSKHNGVICVQFLLHYPELLRVFFCNDSEFRRNLLVRCMCVNIGTSVNFQNKHSFLVAPWKAVRAEAK